MFSLIRLSDTVDHNGDPVALYIDEPFSAILIYSVLLFAVDVAIILKSPLKFPIL